MQFPAPSETFATNDIRELTRQGCDVSVHALRLPHRSADELIDQRQLEAISVSHNGLVASIRGLLTAVSRPILLLRTLAWIVTSTRGKSRHLVRSLLLLPRAFGIFEEIEREEPDVVHVYWGHYPSIVGFLVQSRRPSTATSISLSAYDLEMRFGGTGPVARQADMVRTLAHANVQDVSALTGVHPARISVIPDGVDVAGASSMASRIQKIPFRMVTAGRLVPEKGIDDVIEILCALRTHWPTVSLVVLGDGPDKRRLVHLANRRGVGDAIEFLGHIDHLRVIEELSKAELFLLMSRHTAERLPNVVKEAMACRALCVTTATPGIEELLADGRMGFVVPKRDIETAVRIVDRAFSGGFHESEVLDQAYTHLEANFDIKCTALAYLEAWRKATRPKNTTTVRGLERVAAS